jgi:predicted nucleic acid-binding protein
VAGLVTSLPVLPVSQGYRPRAGSLRARVLAARRRARLADTLVAQSCIDHDVALVTSDRDFRHFAALCGLQLIA